MTHRTMSQTEALEAAARSLDDTVALLRAAAALTQSGAWGRREEIEERIALVRDVQAGIRSVKWYETEHAQR
jgi:hypothetical protein